MVLLRLLHFLQSLNIPTLLTVFRLVISPIAMPILFIQLAPLQSLYINCWLAFLFCLMSSTDFLDGYLARLYNQETQLGRMLDPIADKFLLYSTLISLVAVQKISTFVAIFFIGREFLIMALRQCALSLGFSLKVSALARVKTCFQMLYLAYVIVNPYSYPAGESSIFNHVQMVLLLCVMYLTILTTMHYGIEFMARARKKGRF